MAFALFMAGALLLAYNTVTRADINVILVTNVNDSGPGSLRQAILDANSTPVIDEIRFAFTPSLSPPARVIDIFGELPHITAPVIFNGAQGGNGPGVQLSGTCDCSGPGPDGLTFDAGSNGSEVKQLSFTGFDHAIVLSSAGTTVHDNYIGLGLGGQATGNAVGVRVSGDDNTVGPNNVISGNGDFSNVDNPTQGDAVQVSGSRNIVTGNLIGVAPDGTTPAENIGAGVYIGVSAGANVVGGSSAGAGNVIANNGLGVYIDATVSGNSVIGNLIGVVAGQPGTIAAGNFSGGILIEDSDDNQIIGNVVSANGGPGIELKSANGTKVQGNFIGTDRAGTATGLGNDGDGIRVGNSSGVVIGGTGAGDGNVVVANFFDGIDADFATGLSVLGNSIGLDPLGNSNGNRDNGVELTSTVGAQIGGAGSAGNVISSNGGNGVAMLCGSSEGEPPPDPDGTTIQGNRIGTDRLATLPRGNLRNAISVECGTNSTIGGSDPSLGNYIADSGDSETTVSGIFEGGTGEVIRNNFIGVGSGGQNLGNTGSGVTVGSNFPEILDNTIAFNGGDGVDIVAGTGNPILRNRIHDNGGRAIDLGADGRDSLATPDGSGANLHQHYPVITKAVVVGPNLLVSGTLTSSNPGPFSLEFFGNPPTGGPEFEAQTPLGTVVAVPAGTFTNLTVPAPPSGQRYITATATDADLDTSEVSVGVQALVTPTLTTQSSPNVTLGASVHDTATLAGGATPSGTITFRLYGPNNVTCTGPAVFTDVNGGLEGNGSYDSASFTPLAAGVYRWVAGYSGDSLNAPVSGACNDPNESVTVTQVVTPTLTTTASPAAAPVGAPAGDTAALAGGSSPTGSITFRLYGPNDGTCANPPIFTSTPTTVTGNGSYASAPTFTPTSPGTYRWIASYSGDGTNNPVTGACNALNEQVVVSKAQPTLSTVASPGVTIGSAVSDTAGLAGGFTPTGTLTFRLYGPNDASCAAPPVSTSTRNVTGNASYTSDAFTPAAPGTYRWVASYSGDANNNGVSGACGDPSESVVVSLGLPTLTTTAAGGLVGQPLVDVARVTGGVTPTGTVTFRLYGPGDTACTGPPIFTSTGTLTSSGVATSVSFAAPSPGTYRWVATYSGDARNQPVSGTCGDPTETTTVFGPTTTSTSTTTTSTTTTSTTVPPSTTTSTTSPPTTSTTIQPDDNQPLPPEPTTTTPPTTTTTTPPPTSTTTTPPAPTTTVTATTTPVPTTVAQATPTTAPGPSPTTPTPIPTATTATVQPTTTLAPATTTTSPPGTSSTTTSTTPRTPPPPPGATVDAVNPDGERSGPPGVGLNVSGVGYPDCKTVYFFFDGVRIGSDKPDAAGAVGAKGLSVPGDATPGQHQITSSCRPSEDPVRASTIFTVTSASVHRSAMVTSLARPGQISLDMRRLATSGLAAIAIFILFAFPFELFNSTVEANYDEIRGWFRLPARAVEGVSRTSRNLAFGLLTVVTAVVVGFLSPDFGFNATSLVQVVGFSVALVVMSVGFSIPAALAIHRETGEWGKLNFLPGTVLVSIVMVALSRAFHFQPGYMYGALAGLAFASALSKKTQGRLTAANWTFALVLSVGAFLLRGPVANASSQPGASVWWIGLEAALVLIFLWGIEGLAVAMLPMRFLDGRMVIDWNKFVWALLMFLGLFSTVHVLLAPTSGYVGHTTGQVTVGVVLLFLIFGAISVGLWAYFRYRPDRLNRNRGQRVGEEFLNP